MDVENEASRCAMAADQIKEEGIEVMPTTIPDPPEIGGVEAMRTGKGNLLRNAGTVARKATGRASAGRSAPIQREPFPDKSTREIGTDCTMPKDPEKPEKGLPSCSIAYVHVPKEKRRKLDCKAEKCSMVSYSDAQKGYKCYNHSS